VAGASGGAEGYGPVFARAYDRRLSAFARQAAPRIREYYAGTPAGRRRGPVLDLCCGTGQLAAHFLEHGYRVIGLDRSEAMLGHTREHAGPHVATGAARLVQGDATAFALDERVGLAVSTFDALNHRAGLAALARCFSCVAAALLPDGRFVFDLNTRRGLLTRWNSVTVQDDPEGLLVFRGAYDGGAARALTRITGFLRVADGHFERFAETFYSTPFVLAEVAQALADGGWAEAHFATLEALATPLADPEREGRVFVVTRKAG